MRVAKKAQDLPDLSPAEWEVMKVVWDNGSMATGEIYERVSENRDWAYSTVKTLVRRMAEKGWLEYRPVGNSFLYRPAVSRRRALRSAVKEFSERVLDGMLSPFVAYYAEEKHLSPEDIAELEKLVKRHRKGKGD